MFDKTQVGEFQLLRNFSSMKINYFTFENYSLTTLIYYNYSMEYMFALRAQNRHGFRTVVNTLDGKNISLQVEVCDRQTIYHPSKFF